MLQHISTHSITINCPPGRLFAFIADPANWPKWAVATCEAVKPLPEGCWLTCSVAGAGRLTIDADPARRLIQYDISLQEGSWTLVCEVRPAGANSELLMTFPRPDHCNEVCFEDYVLLAKSRLHRLKTLLGG